MSEIRKLAVIPLVADVVGYSRFAGAGEGSHARASSLPNSKTSTYATVSTNAVRYFKAAAAPVEAKLNVPVPQS